MCSMLQVHPLTAKRPPRPQPLTTTGHPATTWIPSCSSSARWPGRGMSSVSVWRWHRPGPPSMTAGANPSPSAKFLLLLFCFCFSFLPCGNNFLWLMSMKLSTAITDAFFLPKWNTSGPAIDQSWDSLLWEQQSLWPVMLTLSVLLKALRCQWPRLWLPCFHPWILCCLD